MTGFDDSRITTEQMAEVCSRSLNTVDGLWFLAVEEKYGFDTALELDIAVWRRFSLIHARRLVKNFAIRGDTPVRAFVRLLELDPVMIQLKPEFVTLTGSRAVFRCTDCPSQVARLRDNKGLFPGKPVCLAMYSSYAEVIDPRLRVSCMACPPEVQAPPYWCEWQVEF